MEDKLLQILEEDLSDAESQVRRYKERLARACEDVEGRLARLRRHLAEDTHVNGSGEIQAAGPQLDMLCALYEQAIEHRNAAQHRMTRAQKAAGVIK